MKIIINYSIGLIAFLFFFASCNNESKNHEGFIKQNSERPSQAITYLEMASMFKTYDNGQRVALNNYITKKTKGKDSVATISQFFSLSELKQYIAYVEKLSEEKEIDLTGITIFTSAYPEDYKIKEYQNRMTFILAPTTLIDGKNVAYEPLKSGVKKPVSMKSVLDKYADETTKTVNRASIFSFDMYQNDLSSALNRGELVPPFH